MLIRRTATVRDSAIDNFQHMNNQCAVLVVISGGDRGDPEFEHTLLRHCARSLSSAAYSDSFRAMMQSPIDNSIE